jgi:hypothetical protein
MENKKHSAKDIIVKPIPKPLADKIVLKYHYSGKVVTNSQLCFGIYLKGILLGAMEFGPPTDKRKMLPIVKGTTWNGMLELNRMAFSDALPPFCESRAISYALRWIKKNAPGIKWILSFADGTQCGHGTIYQATNFYLTQINKNCALFELPDGRVVHQNSLRPDNNPEMRAAGFTSIRKYLKEKYPGYKILPGYMFRYIYFLDHNAKENYTGEIIPFSKIKELGIQMYKGHWVAKDE